MKPKTKLQKQVAGLSTKLPELTGKQREWAITNCFEKKGYLRKRSVWCTECGRIWEPTDGSLVLQLTDTHCPHCGVKLNLITSNKRKCDEREYYSIFTTCKGFQVLRHFVARRFCRVGYPANYEVNEAVQNWIGPDGKVILMSRSARMSYYYFDLWDWGSPLEVRSRPRYEQKYNIHASYIYPGRRYITELKRNGFKGYYHGIKPLSLFESLLSNSKAETLMKVKQYDMLRYIHKWDKVSFWPSIRICIRNGYNIKDASIWHDYVKMLERLGKDVLNPHYVCPDNLSAAHDKASNKIHRIKEKQDLENKRKKSAEYESAYREMKSKFFDICFSDDLIQIGVLQSVHDFLEEGTEMHHCVYGSEYYMRDDSLILSARIGEKRIETIEVSLKKMDVVQSRGVCNKSTEYHDRIIGLVRKNMNMIQKRITA